MQLKKHTRFFMLAASWLGISVGAYAQNDFQCLGHDAEPLQVPKMSAACNTNTLKYIPDAYTYQKKVKINIHFMCKTEAQPLNFTGSHDGLGNTSLTGYDFAETVVGFANAMLNGNTQMAQPPGNTTPVLPITYRFSLEGVYFHYNINQYTYQNSGSSTSTYAVNPTSEINLFYYYDATGDPDGDGNENYANGGSAGGATVRILGAWQTYRDFGDMGFWGAGGLIKHEVSHCLSLLHSVHNNNGSCASTTFTDYCSDTPDRWYMMNTLGLPDPCCGSNGSGPHCTNNFMDYTGGVAMTPEQLGRVEFELMNNKFAYIKQEYCTKVPGAQYVIGNNSDLVWENSRIINRDLIIEGGSRLTVKCRLYMSSDAKIIVKPGGRLVLDGGELTGTCNQFWQGVEVWGTTSQNQYPSGAPTYQGRIELKNSAVIENAHNAVRLWNPNDWNAIGGVVVSNGATFRNNRRSVEFMAYSNILSGNVVNNLSSFTNTTFTINNSFLGSATDFYSHVTMWQVKGIGFRGCTFEDMRSTHTFGTTHGKGIYSIDAGFSVVPYCSVGIPVGQTCPTANTTNAYVRGLNYGIHATGNATAQNITVDQVFFDKNVKGVQVEAQNNFAVTRSDFTIGQSNASATGGIHEGIVSVSSSGYKIEENILRKASPSVATSTVGIRVDNSGTAANRLYRNTTQNLSVGEQVRGQNRNPNNAFQGVQVLCSQHAGNSNDIAVNILNLPSSNDGARTFQGETNLSAGNVFSAAGTNFANTTSWPITYYHMGGTTNPVFHTTLVYPTLVSIAHSCTSSFGGLILAPRLLSDEYEIEEQQYNDLLYLYTQLTQNGNDAALQQRVQTAWPEEALALRSELLARSPYVSAEVLKEVARRGTLPQALLLEVCLANPESTRGEDFARFLQEEAAIPLAPEMVDLVREGWGSATARTQLENRLARHSEAMALQGDNALQALMQAEETRMEDIRTWLSRRGTLTDMYHLAETHLEQKNYAVAETVLAALFEKYNNTVTFNAHEHAGYLTYLHFLQKLTAEGRTVAQLTDAETQELGNFAKTHTGRIAVMAQNVLCFFYGQCNDVPTEVVPTVLAGNSTAGAPAGHASVADMPVAVYPNPAREFVYFRWEQPAAASPMHLRITDLTGRTVVNENLTDNAGNWLWDTRAQKAGTYLYEMLRDGKSVASGKIIVNP